MSKSETPCPVECLPSCRYDVRATGERQLIAHTLGCPNRNAPKAEAPRQCVKECRCDTCEGEGGHAPTDHNYRSGFHAPNCPKYKAEAPPAPVSEVYEDGIQPGHMTRSYAALMAKKAAPVSEPPFFVAATKEAERLLQTVVNRNDASWILARAHLALKAQNAALNAEVLTGLSQINNKGLAIAKLTDKNDALTAQNATLTAERDKFEAESEQKGADLMACEGMLAEARAEVERLRDLIVGAFETGTGHGLLQTEARAIRAAREAGKS